MRILRDYKFIANEDRGASVAIGNFDGVHIGHQSVISLAKAAILGIKLYKIVKNAKSLFLAKTLKYFYLVLNTLELF